MGNSDGRFGRLPNLLIMTYQETLDYLFTQLPVFQHQGQSAYKPGLDTARSLSALFGNPHESLRCIHIAGTNGKGSTAHTLAAVLQHAGYRTGLFTSPHLIDFRERIRIDGRMIGRDEVIDFTERWINSGSELRPSFFELTTIMAFEWFARNKVDVAVIEAGLGGRLDTTNIIMPDLSVITNISLDHTALLGDTPSAIAVEKAGIIKDGVPVVVGEAQGEVRDVFVRRAAEMSAPIEFAEDNAQFSNARLCSDGWHYYGTAFGDIRGELSGDCQQLNAATVLCALRHLRGIGYKVNDEDVAHGFAHVTADTGLMGRWMKLGDSPLTVCDTGHNIGGWQYIAHRLKAYRGVVHLILGFVSDKDVSGILRLVKTVAEAGSLKLYLTRASVERAMTARQLALLAAEQGLRGDILPDVPSAYKKALAGAGKGDMIFVGGSTFVVADLLKFLNP